MKNFSIITDFGCPFACSFCITKSQKTKKAFAFDESVFNKIEKESKGYERISVSGGGEPLFIHNKEIEKFYSKLFEFSKQSKIPIHVHTNLDKPNKYVYQFDKVTISINGDNYQNKFESWKDIKDKRFVHVSDGTDINLINEMIKDLPFHSQLTIKQLESKDLVSFFKIIELSKEDKRVMFLPTGDYNTYFFLNDSKIYSEFKKIKFKENQK